MGEGRILLRNNISTPRQDRTTSEAKTRKNFVTGGHEDRVDLMAVLSGNDNASEWSALQDDMIGSEV